MPASSLALDSLYAIPGCKRLLNLLNTPTMETRFVGGCVRDALLGHPISDIDFATTALPQTIIQHFEQQGISVKPIGLAHGTVMAILDKHTFEITTLRQDVACDGRHAEIRFTKDWQQDAARRDFTMNAMSLSADGTLHDYFGGQADLAKGIIRFVGMPALRIQEDYLRILRYFRFMARFGFSTEDADTYAACRLYAPALTRLSAERIGGEMMKLFAAPDPTHALALMQQLHILEVICPFPLGPVVAFAPLLAMEKTADIAINPLLRLSYWLRHFPSISATAPLGTAWKLSLHQQKQLQLLTSHPLLPIDQPFSEYRAFVRALGKAEFELLLLLSYALKGKDIGAETVLSLPSLLKQTHAWPIPSFPVSGNELCDRFSLTQGPALGAIKKQLEQWWEAHHYPSKDAVLDYAAQLLEQH